jgi:hypothetical protein
MSKNTVKPGLTRKRAKRVKENPEYAAFTRRVLAAYGRRVGSGDLEALTSMAHLSVDVDTALRHAIDGLRRVRYSWDEIAVRLGVTRQAAQMRYGKASDRGVLDRRLIEAGLTVSVAELVAVYVDHHPGVPASSACPGCGYRYPDSGTECPTNALVRPLLYRRRGEDKQAVARLTPDQRADLYGQKTTRRGRPAPSLTPPVSPNRGDTQPLFDLASGGDAR